jgi:Family of unknown function (DUF6152)
VLLFVSSASAHHSFAAEYDNNKQVTVKGLVQKVAWVNPHAYVYIDVTDENGKVTTWAFESLSPNALARSLERIRYCLIGRFTSTYVMSSMWTRSIWWGSRLPFKSQIQKFWNLQFPMSII